MNVTGIVFGVGAPNQTRSGEKTMCAILLTKEMGFIRVYPIPAEDSFPVWSLISCEVDRGNDYRQESYKLFNCSITGKILDAQEKRHILDSAVLKSGTQDPMQFQNENRCSIFLTKLEWGQNEVTLSQRVPSYIPSEDEENGWIVTQGRHWLKPYLTWTSVQGSTHTSHLGGREVYEGLRNNPSAPWNLMNNLQVMNPDWEMWLLMGNMKDRPNVWLCVHLHRLKKTNSGSIPLFSHPIIGGSADWPYCKQQTSNVPVADDQPMLFATEDMSLTKCRGNTAMSV